MCVITNECWNLLMCCIEQKGIEALTWISSKPLIINSTKSRTDFPSPSSMCCWDHFLLDNKFIKTSFNIAFCRENLFKEKPYKPCNLTTRNPTNFVPTLPYFTSYTPIVLLVLAG